MKGIIILEGPDGSGKTTLAKKLAQKYDGAILHQSYRFKNKIHLYYLAVLKKAYILAEKKLVILDRFHISEEIYAKIFRGGTKWPWLINIIEKLCQELKIPIILCIPENIKQGIDWFEEVKNQREEQYNDIAEVIKEYLIYSKNNVNSKIIIYNKDEKNCYEKIIKRLEGLENEKISESVC